MKRKTLRVAGCAIALMVLSGVAAFAAGGGGFYTGYQTSRYPILDQYGPPSNNMSVIYYGGYGYGVSHDGVISGGFGFGFGDSATSSELAGGFGGVISGYRFLYWPVNLSLVTWTGVGGVYTGNSSLHPHNGYFCVSAELDLEVGLPVLPWFMPVVYAGYQFIGNLSGGKPFDEFISYTPVVGVRFAWGGFRR